MSGLTLSSGRLPGLPAQVLPHLSPSRETLSRWGAVVLALALHLGLAALLLAGWPVAQPGEPRHNTVEIQLLTLPPPKVAPAPEPEPAAPAPAIETPPPDRAELARKRIEREREQERQRQAQQAREAEQQRRDAEQREAAERERRRAAAERAHRAQAEAEAAASRQYEPIVKSAPEYPRRALEQGIQGDCTVRYTVDPQGAVENPEVVGTCHPLFIRPSLEAARAFRYQPRIVDGRAVAVPNVKNTFNYRIQ